jgi:hypothetical protein
MFNYDLNKWIKIAGKVYTGNDLWKFYKFTTVHFHAILKWKNECLCENFWGLNLLIGHMKGGNFFFSTKIGCGSHSKMSTQSNYSWIRICITNVGPNLEVKWTKIERNDEVNDR